MLRVSQSTTMSPTGSSFGSPVRFSNTVTITRRLAAADSGRANQAIAANAATAVAPKIGHQDRTARVAPRAGGGAAPGAAPGAAALVGAISRVGAMGAA